MRRLSICLALLAAIASCKPNHVIPASSLKSPSPQAAAASLLPSPSPEAAPSPSKDFARPVGSPPGLLQALTSGAALAGGPGGPPIRRIRAGVVMPFDAVRNGWARVRTPCDDHLWVKVAEVSGLPDPEVVLDPGHGGDELGAQGPGGLTEKEVNLDVAQKAMELLESRDKIKTVLSRTSDYRATLEFRTAVAVAAQPKALVSIHHNSVPDGPRDQPGTETYFQFGSGRSKRLAGLLYQETTPSLAQFHASWVGDTDAGAKWRLNGAGADYYAILRRPRQSGVTASLAELAFISNPSEESLLAREEVRVVEAQAISRAVQKFLWTKDPGSGFTVPYPRTEPAGPGGGGSGCVDPA